MHRRSRRISANRVSKPLIIIAIAIIAVLSLSLLAIFSDSFVGWAAYLKSSSVKDSKSAPEVGKFPSTLVAILRAGAYGWAAPTDPETLSLIPDEYKKNDATKIDWVKRWQVEHADICAACEDFTPEMAKKTIAMDYNFYQSMRASPRFEEIEMRKKLIIDDKADEWEKLFLHFDVDTFVDVDEVCEYQTPWVGRPVVGYVNKSEPNGQGLSVDESWNLDVFANNGILYVGMPEKFDEIIVDVEAGAKGGSLIFEYAVGINSTTMKSTDKFSPESRWIINKWNKLDINDGTANFATDGLVTFKPPSNWAWGTPYPAYFPGGNPEVGSEFAYGGGYYWIRIKVGEPFGKRPVLNKITTPAWITLEKVNEKNAVKIPGWDPNNDINKDGYIDSNEMESPAYNKKATARFIHEGRVAHVCTLGKDFPYWGRQAANLWNQEYIDLRAEFTANLNVLKGFTGNFNDEAYELLWGGFSTEPLVNETDRGPVILSGGTTIEGKALKYGDGGVRDPTMAYKYAEAFIDLWSQIKKETKSNWIGINTFQPYRWPLMRPFVESDTFDFFINEDTIRAVQPYIERGSELYGFSKIWFVPAMNKIGKKIFMMGYLSPGDGLSNTEEGWKRRKEAVLAVYYLWNIPGMTVFVANADYYYEMGGNTGPKMYYKGGVPYDIAMQPTEMLEVDIGVPNNAPKGYSYVPYLACAPYDKPYYYCSTIVGNSGDKALTLPGYGTGTIKTFPTNQYFLYAKYEGEKDVANYLEGTAPSNSAPGTKIPVDMVIARSYTKGLVLYRTSYGGLQGENFNHYTNFNQITISLPDVYQRILPDGTLAKPSKTIELRGYEGAILKKPVIREVTLPKKTIKI